MRPPMETIWMDLAVSLTARSTCQRNQVGAVVTSKNLERVYSIGYNGGAKGQNNECESNEPGKCGHLHAEINALIKCQVNDPEKVLFVTVYPCSLCAKAIVNSGFSKVYFREPYREEHDVFKKTNIEVRQI